VANAGTMPSVQTREIRLRLRSKVNSLVDS